MRVFVSWSGDHSKFIASALKEWLPFVFQGLDVWMSEQNIHAGANWNTELGKALQECKLGIICLTSESLRSRWLTFEAGALSAAINQSRVIPYLFQLKNSDVSPPLSQFQSVVADRDGTYKLVRSINDALGNLWGEEEKLRTVFLRWWPDLEKQLDNIEQVDTTQIRSDRDLLEEILDLARQTGIRDLNTILGQLFACPNIKRIEVATKEVAGATTNRLSLRITVAKKLPLAEVPRDQLIPSSVFGMPTDVVEGSEMD